MDMNKEIKNLESIHLEKPERVFSMYLNTDPADPEQQGGEWKIHLKNGLKNFEKHLQEDEDADEKRNFKKVKKKVESYIRENELDLAKSVVIFATADDSVWFAERFQIAVKTEFYWRDIAKVDQLITMSNDFPKTGVILTQRDAIKILNIELGTLKDTELFELDIETEDWRHHTGPHRATASRGSGGKSTKREQFQARFEANRHRWYKSIAPKLDKMAKDNGWKHIYLVGEKEEARDLGDHMQKPINAIIEKNMLEHDESKVIKEIFSH